MANGGQGAVGRNANQNQRRGIRNYLRFLRNGYVQLGLAAVGLGLLAWGVSLTDRGRETLYDKVTDDGRRVKYVEDSDGENGMSVNYGKNSFKYIDLEGATSIDWISEREPSYINDKLERIEARIDGKDYILTIDNINENTLEGKRAKDMFERANKDYNDRRKKIRDELRKGYDDNTSSLNRFFGNTTN